MTKYLRYTVFALLISIVGSCVNTKSSSINQLIKDATLKEHEFFVVKMNRDTIVGPKLKLNQHIGSKKQMDITINNQTFVLSEIYSFQDKDGHAQRINSDNSTFKEVDTKGNLYSNFAIYIAKGKNVNLLFRSRVVGSYYSMSSKSRAVRYNAEFFIEDKKGYFIECNRELLPLIAEGNTEALSFLSKHKSITRKTDMNMWVDNYTSDYGESEAKSLVVTLSQFVGLLNK